MASRFSCKSRKDGITSRQHPHKVGGRRAPAKVDGKGHHMTLIRKLLLSAQLTGMEATMNFQQIYTVPVLQTLGMPLSLTYVMGLVSGPSSLFFLPLLGWLIDRGSNRQCRQFASIVFAVVLQVLGMLCLLLANTVHLQHLLDYNSTVHVGSVPPEYVIVTLYPASGGNEGLFVGEFGKNASWLNEEDMDFGASIHEANLSSEVSGISSFNVPLKAGLGMVGFILMDLSFDVSNSFVKTFLITCSPREEQTSMIVLGVMMGAVGGVINSALGLLDFTAILGFSSIEGAKLTIQTSIQGLFVIFMVIVGLLSTFITGRIQLRQLRQHESQAVAKKVPENRTKTGSTKLDDNSITSDNFTPPPEHEHRRNSVVEAFENSIRSFGGSSVFLDYSVSLREEKPLSLAEDAPLLEDHTLEEEVEKGDEEEDGYLSVSLSIAYGAVEDPAPQTKEETSSVRTLVEDVEGQASEEREQVRRLPCLHNPKVRIFFVCLTSFFSVHAQAIFAFTVSDIVGKGIYGGDPFAEPGSESLNRYQEGMQMASWALLVYFIAYLVSSMLHQKVLAILGFRLEFLLLQILLTVTMLVTALTKRLELIFVLSMVAGTHRTCFYTMPYAVTNDIAQSIVSTGTGRSPIGQAMSLVAASIPLSYCLLFTWAGAVQELTGDVSTPLLLGSAAGFLGIVAFLFVGKV